jgi:hypothetical protein
LIDLVIPVLVQVLIQVVDVNFSFLGFHTVLCSIVSRSRFSWGQEAFTAAEFPVS